MSRSRRDLRTLQSARDMEDTVWWNDWRDVEFRSGGNLPDADNCHDGTTCTWLSRTKGRRWSSTGAQAGEHTVELSKDRRRMKVHRFDGMTRAIRKRDCGEPQALQKAAEELGTGADDGTQLYDGLELDSSTYTAQIKKQFRRLSRKYHPDKNRNDLNAAAKFEQIREAYEVIGNPDKRTLYDTGGLEQCVKQRRRMQAWWWHGPARCLLWWWWRREAASEERCQRANGGHARRLLHGNPVSFSIKRRVVPRV